MSDKKSTTIDDLQAENELLTNENAKLQHNNTTLTRLVEEHDITIGNQNKKIAELQEANEILESVAREAELKSSTAKKNEVIEHNGKKLECKFSSFYHDRKKYDSATAPKEIIDVVLKLTGQGIYKILE